MRAPLMMDTAIRQANKTIYTRRNASLQHSKKWARNNDCSTKATLVFIIAPTLSRVARRVTRPLPATQPLKRIPENEVQLKHLVRDLRSQPSRLLLPAATILVFVLVGWSYRSVTPLLETPDEPAHFAVANYIAQNNRLSPRPEQTRQGPAPTASADVPFYYAPPLYYLLASSLISEANSAQFAQAVIPNPNFARGVGLNLDLSAENKNMYVHTAEQRSPHQAQWATSMARVRLFSLFLGMVTVAGCYVLAQQVWPKKWGWRITAVCLVLFNPTFLYLSNGVSNDALLIALSTWCFALMGSLLHQDAPIGWREWTLALLLGSAILTKQTGFILLPPALLLMVYKARQREWSHKRFLAVIGTGLVVITAVGGWWYVVNGIRYGDPLALESHNALPAVANVSQRLLFVAQQGWGAFKSYWAAFGWATIFVAPIWIVFFIALTGFGFTGWLFPNNRPSTKLTNLLWLTLLINSGLMLFWLWRTAAPYGRLLFPVIAPIACLLVLGWQRWLARLHLPAIVGQLAVVLPLATLALIAPTRYVQPAFAPVAVPPTQVPDFLPLDATFGDAFHLLGYTIDPMGIQTGSDVTLTLVWQLVRPSAAQNMIQTFVQVAPVDPEAQVAVNAQLLGTPRYPATFWQPDEIIVQQYQLEISSTTPAPSLYWFDLVLFDETTEARLPVSWQGQPLAGDLLRIGPEPILARETPVIEKTAVSTATPYIFDQQIQLNGYAITPNDSGLEVTLFWEALAQPSADWIVFVHLINEAGELVVQGDGPPRQGNFPTRWWTAGTTIPDSHLLAGNLDCADLKQHTLLVGFYNPTTAERLPVSDATGQSIPNAAVAIQPACAEGGS